MRTKVYSNQKAQKLPDSNRSIGKFFGVFLLFFAFFTTALQAQNVPVKGKVVDEKGQPIIGATIKVKNGTGGGTTDINGNFQINAPANATLVVSSLSYNPEEVRVGNNANLVVTLTASSQSLQDVVVVGYGTQKKIDVTGSVASVNLEAQRDIPNTNIAQYLQGTVPGLNVGISTTAGGTPPISVRGQNTLNGSQNVLIVLDGIQYTGSLSSINPDDIASIDVLKDASSTAVYGAQAANGVILITTRKGKNNQAPRISFSTSYSTQRPTNFLRSRNREEYLQGIRNAYYNLAYLGPDYTQPNPNFNVGQYVDASMRDAAFNVLPNDFDWVSAATKTGKIAEANLSINGGSENFNYLISGGIVDQNGFIINDKFKRKSIRVNLESKPLSWWKIGVQSSGSFVNQDGAEPGLGLILTASPLLKPFDAAGNIIPFPTNTLVPNPFLTYYVDDYDRNNYYFANFYTDIDFPFLKGLNYHLNFGNNVRNSPHFFSSIYGANQTGQAYKNYDDYYDYTLDNILTYTKSVGKHDITGTLLYGSIERKGNSTQTSATGFPRLNLSYNDLSLGNIRTITSSGYKEALNYQMARLNYKYNDRYLLTATVRRDGFSGFSANYKSAIFPVLALGWIVTEEEFMKKLPVFDLLKLRAGYGTTGNQTPRYSSLPTVAQGPTYSYVFGDGGTTANGQQVTALGNPDLKWERTKGLNFGVDFALFKNRLTGTIDYYRNKTTDLIYSVNIPQITGFSNIRTNIGQLQNSGLEVQLTYNVIREKNFSWSTTGNFSLNRNKIVTLTGVDANGDGKEDDLIASGLFIGKSIQTVYDYVTDGIYGLNDTRLPGFPVGSVRIKDLNGDGQITPEGDRTFIGKREPAYRFSWYNTFNYKNLSFSFFINSIQGGSNGYLGNNNLNYGSGNIAFFRDDNSIRNNDLADINYWSPSNPGGEYPLNISGTRARVEPNRWYDRSFIRLQDASLSYNFASMLKKFKVRSVNLYVSGKNLVTWTKWKGWDPETVDTDPNSATYLQANGGLNPNGRPTMRAFTLGLNVTY